MKAHVWLIFGGVLLSSCRQGPQTGSAAATKDPKEETHQESVTHWTGRTELFMEYPTLIGGTKGRFAIHLTRLENFKPLKTGRVEVRLRGQDGSTEVFTTPGPSRPG